MKYIVVVETDHENEYFGPFVSIKEAKKFADSQVNGDYTVGGLQTPTEIF